MSVKITTTGPIFKESETAAATKAFLNKAEEDIAQKGVNLVRERLGDVLRHPTGYYERHIQTDITSAGTVVTDGGVIYGPWLEGVGSRNKTTRFKGYATFRKVTQQLQEQAGAIAEKDLPHYLEALS